MVTDCHTVAHFNRFFDSDMEKDEIISQALLSGSINFYKETTGVCNQWWKLIFGWNNSLIFHGQIHVLWSLCAFCNFSYLRICSKYQHHCIKIAPNCIILQDIWLKFSKSPIFVDILLRFPHKQTNKYFDVAKNLYNFQIFPQTVSTHLLLLSCLIVQQNT